MRKIQFNELVDEIKSSIEFLPRYDLHTCNYKMEEDEGGDYLSYQDLISLIEEFRVDEEEYLDENELG